MENSRPSRRAFRICGQAKLGESEGLSQDNHGRQDEPVDGNAETERQCGREAIIPRQFVAGSVWQKRRCCHAATPEATDPSSARTMPIGTTQVRESRPEFYPAQEL